MSNIDKNFWMYFEPDEERPFNRNKDANWKRRYEKACEQRALVPVPVEQVIKYANDFFTKIKEEQGAGAGNKLKNWPKEVELDGKKHPVVGNCLIVRGCDWWYDPTQYTQKPEEWKYDPKYDVIRRKFGLGAYNNLVWLKFAREPGARASDTPYLGVVAAGGDVNFSYDSLAGKLVKEVGLEWDTSFVCIFPLPDEMLRYRYREADGWNPRKQREEIETGLGNYLIAQGVPIIDYYSHNY